MNWHIPTNCLRNLFCNAAIVGRYSVVGIATRYGLDVPGIEFRWRRDIPHPSRQGLTPTQPPGRWETEFLSRG